MSDFASAEGHDHAHGSIGHVLSVRGSEAKIGLPAPWPDHDARATVGKFLSIASGRKSLIGMIIGVIVVIRSNRREVVSPVAAAPSPAVRELPSAKPTVSAIVATSPPQEEAAPQVVAAPSASHADGTKPTHFYPRPAASPSSRPTGRRPGDPDLGY